MADLAAWRLPDRELTELRDVRAVVADAVQLGRCSISELAGELSGGPVRGSAMFRSALAKVADGGLTRLAPSPEHWDRTRHRHDLMGAAGIIPLHFSPRDLRTKPHISPGSPASRLRIEATCPL